MGNRPLIIFILGKMPLYFLTDEETASVFVQNTPFVLEWLLRLASAGIFISAILGFFLLPKRPKNRGIATYGVMLLQWVLLPVSLVFFGSLPAIDAQTRLMINKPLGFFVTPKRRTEQV